MRLGIRTGLLGLALATACDQDALTEHRQVRLTIEMQPGDTFVSGEPIVEQSTVCVEIAGLEEDDDVAPDDAATCYDERLVGPATRDEDGCIALPTSSIGRPTRRSDRPMASPGELRLRAPHGWSSPREHTCTFQ